jgi:hypothetical protein
LGGRSRQISEFQASQGYTEKLSLEKSKKKKKKKKPKTNKKINKNKQTNKQKRDDLGTGEMVQQLRALILSSIPSNHMVGPNHL